MSDLTNTTVEYTDHTRNQARNVVRLAAITAEKARVPVNGERWTDLDARETALTARVANDTAVTAAKDAVEVN